MKSFVAFIKKELLDQVRSNKLLILGIIFCAFGIMNPAVAKLTPWLLEMMADSLAESGMTVTEVTVSALDSWVQFFKNIPMALLAFVLLQSNIFTKEYDSGTLILSLTKGLERYKVVLAKEIMLCSLWTIGYLLCFGVTTFYNVYYWGSGINEKIIFALISWWLFGIFIISLITLFSTLARSNSSVLLGIAGLVFASYLLGLIPKITKYLPTFLTDSNSLIYEKLDIVDYVPSLIIVLIATAFCFISSIPLFNKKQL
jgi:ABC-2 type transport system permease protein